MKDISFIIPVYNTPIDKLECCIKSILKLRNRFEIEIVVVDDGSKDFIRTFFQREYIGEIKYFYKENGGVSSARNVGMANAEGKFISFVDADDVIIDDAYDLINISDKYQFFIFDIDVIENNKETTWKVLRCNPGMVEKKDVIEELVTGNKMNSPCSKLFLNSFVKQHGIRFDEKMVTGEDMNFVIDYTQHVTNIYYTGKSAYCYYREEASRVTRIKKFPDIYFNNLSFLRDKLEKLIVMYDMDVEYIYALNIDHVESVYNYISDLMMAKMCTPKRKETVRKEIQNLKIKCSNASRKKKIKYVLLLRKKWIIINVLAYLRKMYLSSFVRRIVG